MNKNKTTYINKKNVENSLRKMQEFEKDLDSLFNDYDLSLRENTGRRNVLLSQAQEVFFSKEIESEGYNVSCSGKTGEPDISIHSLGRELECKLTSSKKRSWPLQCDYSTLQKKGYTDFLYVLADETFDKFAVLFFDSLTIEDFHPPASGSRQKSRMKKSSAMKKCIVLHGSVNNKSIRHIQKYTEDLKQEIDSNLKRISDLNRRLNISNTEYKKKSVSKMIKNESTRHKNKTEKLHEKIQHWKESTQQYEIKLACI